MNRGFLFQGSVMLAACLFMLGAGDGGQDETNKKIQLLGTEFREPEWPEVKSGESWWGLFKNQDGSFELAETTISLEQKKNECIGGDVPYISLADKRKPIFLVRGSQRLRAGPVRVSHHGLLRLLPGETHRVHDFVLYGLGNTAGLHPQLSLSIPEIENYSINITNDRHTVVQELVHVEKTTPQEEFPNILWIGDLDRDGLPDVYLDAQPYPGGEYILYLSSEARQGEIARKVATLWHRSC